MCEIFTKLTRDFQDISTQSLQVDGPEVYKCEIFKKLGPRFFKILEKPQNIAYGWTY